jgi:hypothetical protein
VLQNGSVDLIISAMTINCARWQQIAFSAEYYRAGQKLLVQRGSKATSLDDLGGQLVCAPAGSTSLDKLKTFPDVKVVTAATQTDCLVKFQQGQTDAITGDDTVLAGLAAQDPYAKVVGDPFTNEPYGIGAAAGSTDLVRYVNAVLGKPRTTAGWRPRSARHQHHPPPSTDADADLVQVEAHQRDTRRMTFRPHEVLGHRSLQSRRSRPYLPMHDARRVNPATDSGQRR